MDRGAWRTTVRGVTKSQTQLSTRAEHYTKVFLVFFLVVSCSMWDLTSLTGIKPLSLALEVQRVNH